MKKIVIVFALILTFIFGTGVGAWLQQARIIPGTSDVSNFNSANASTDWINPNLASVIQVNQENSISGSAFELQNAFNTVANVATRAVVSIQVTATVKNQNNFNFFGNDEFFRRFFGTPNQPSERRSEGFGSGFVVDPEGYLVSNHHVIDGAEEIKILFKDNETTYTAEVVGADPDTDIALLKINEKGPFPYLPLGDSEAVQIGDIAIAIGNPFGLSHTFTTGVVSAKGRTGILGNRYENFIQTDVAINQGNSGGPLLNLKGEVIGVNSAILSRSGGSIGIGFSIPINMVKNVTSQLRTSGKVSRGWIGIGFSEVSTDLAEALDVPKGSVQVSEVFKDSPAEKANIQAGDIVYSFNGTQLKNGQDLINQIGTKTQGDKVIIGVIRDGKRRNFTITLDKQKENSVVVTDQQQKTPESGVKNNLLGVSVRELTSDERKDLGVRNNLGILITAINPESPLNAVGIQADDVVLALNRKPIRSLEDFNTQAKSLEKGSKVLMQVQRGRAMRYVIIQI